MRAIIIVGLGFGDEGKGATIDFLARQLNADWVVRYCGGAQAGHNVQLPGGKRHTFSQFGAGTLAGARTWLGPRMIISPATMVPEAEHLQSLGVNDPWSQLAVSPQCLVATTYHMALNRLREQARGNNRHGSCGLGIGEARSYWLRYGVDAITAADLHDRAALLPKLALLRDRLLQEMQTLSWLEPEWAALLHDTLPHEEATSLRRVAERLAMRAELPKNEVVLFEGAQGVLLDEWKGFHPYTTWSTVTPQHAWELLAEADVGADVQVMGVVRSYSTRHGAGPFPTACRRMTRQMRDPGNPRNPWQGGLRFGPLDLVLTRYAAEAAEVDALVVNHLDECAAPLRICDEYAEPLAFPSLPSLPAQQALSKQLQAAQPVLRETGRDGLLDALAAIAPLGVLGNGPTYSNRESLMGPRRPRPRASAHESADSGLRTRRRQLL